MPLPNIFEKEVTDQLIARISRLSPQSAPLWGKMAVGQMLAHCNVAYEFCYDNIHSKPNAIKKFFVKLFAKDMVVGEKPYKKSIPTAPEMRIQENKDFLQEKERLLNYLQKTHKLGESHFHNLESHSFGRLTKTEWSNLFYKHLDHHLQQFGV